MGNAMLAGRAVTWSGVQDRALLPTVVRGFARAYCSSPAVALFLGAVGIYGVISYVVSQRTREIGVRMALGAEKADVSRMVLKQAGLLALGGVVIGLVAAAGLTRLMSSLLFGVSPVDPVTFGSVAAALALIALLASYLPARRASGVDPVVALRFE